MDFSKYDLPERIREPLDWQADYTKQELKEAKKLLPGVRLRREWRGYSAKIRDGIRTWNSHLYYIPDMPGETFESHCRSCNCPDGSRSGICRHTAAMIMRYEAEFGRIMLEESDYAYRKRRTDAEVRILTDERRRKTAASEKILLSDLFQEELSREGLILFDLSAALKGMYTTRYHVDQMRMIGQAASVSSNLKVTVTREGEKRIAGRLFVIPYADVDADLAFSGEAVCQLLPTKFLSLSSEVMPVTDTGLTRKDDLGTDAVKDLLADEFVLVLVKALFPLAAEAAEEDQTDKAAIDFFQSIDREDIPVKETAAPKKANAVVIAPRIVVEDGKAILSFKAGISGKKMLILRNLAEFCSAYSTGKSVQISKNEKIDFSVYDLSEGSAKWMDFIRRRIGEIDILNDKLYSPRYGYASVSATYQQDLKGSTLDHFYDTAEGDTCEYQDKTNNIKGNIIRVGHHPVRFRLSADRLADARGNFAGIAVSGHIPVMISGASSRYILNGEYLSRISPEEIRTFRPFDAVSDASGYFRFQVGREKLGQFYYRVLPKLMENPCVEMDNNCDAEVQKYLPPEPAFSFYLDYISPVLSCRGEVSYGDQVSVLQKDPSGEERGYFDEDAEKRAVHALEHFLSEYDPKNHIFSETLNESELYTFLRDGLPWLEGFGNVKGTDAFRKLRVRPVPQIQVGVSVDSGIMDLSVTSAGLSDNELLDILDSYKRKQKYYRLSSGEFIDLESDTQLGEVQDLIASMDLIPTDVIRRSAHIPVYRALYLDRMLEEHENVVSSRDRVYRNLIRNFGTVKDADYETPAALENVLRPYQSFGYKWLRTLEEYGFGGILADEMGLGKTVQMIAVFLAAKENGNTRPSLVVCPASLVYNWQEEIRRFAPELTVFPLAGSTGERKKEYDRIRQGENKDVYIISYDLLKRDVTQFEDLFFYSCVLDEAQYIKNQKSAASKSVKVIHAEHRYALTGTPIENRLSELWSIFDFLMPGFLYGTQEFVSRFETPITKQKDEAVTAKLKKMVGPFILRRKKEDVLKDLPAKLEEVHYARFRGEQQKLYDAEVIRMRKMIDEGNFFEERFRIFAGLTRIRQICCDPSLLFEDYQGESSKREACLELIQSAVDGGHRILLFSQFTSMLALLEEDLAELEIPYFKITGDTPKQTRISLVHQFNDGDTPLFLISLKAGGTGLNLTGADVVIHYDPWWNLAAQNQATDRAHRIGQTKQVTVYKMIIKDSIEEKILELQNAKKDLADAILEGRSESLMNLSPDELLELIA